MTTIAATARPAIATVRCERVAAIAISPSSSSSCMLPPSVAEGTNRECNRRTAQVLLRCCLADCLMLAQLAAGGSRADTRLSPGTTLARIVTELVDALPRVKGNAPVPELWLSTRRMLPAPQGWVHAARASSIQCTRS